MFAKFVTALPLLINNKSKFPSRSMNIQDFLNLTAEDQLNTVWEKATYLKTHEDSQFRFNLYALDNFYIEIKYDIKRNSIVEKVVFRHTELLDRYLF